jgi:hypothetical protein
MAALALSQQRASKNNLRRNFIALKRHQGHQVEFIQDDSSLGAEGKKLEAIGKSLAKVRRTELLLNATTLTRPEHDELQTRIQENEGISERESWCMTRTGIERFYRRPITAEIIELDNKGRLREQISTYEKFILYAQNAENRKRMGLSGDLPVFNPKDLKAKFIRDERNTIKILYELVSRTPVFASGSFMPNSEFSFHNLSEFYKEARRLKTEIETALNIEVRKSIDGATKQLSAFLQVIGLDTQMVRKTRNKLVNKGQAIYLYKLSHDHLTQVTEIARARDKMRGWSFLYDLYGWKAEEDIS